MIDFSDFKIRIAQKTFWWLTGDHIPYDLFALLDSELQKEIIEQEYFVEKDGGYVITEKGKAKRLWMKL